MTSATTNMLIAALGGEGGGVLTNWLIEIADRSGWYCQSTSLAGVAQRTGATIYYLEFMRRVAGKPAPVMSLFPAQGDIDIAVSSEISEAGRMISRGFVSPDRTTLISSDHRVFGITEKIYAGEGIVDTALIIEMAARYSQHFVHFDILELVQRHDTVISAGLLGAVAGTGALPFEQEVFRELLAEGNGGSANLNAFDESCQRAASGAVIYCEPEVDPPFFLPEPTSTVGKQLLPEISKLPETVHELVYHAVIRLLDYQDALYAQLFLERAKEVIAADSGENQYELSRHTLRFLALWMAFEDIPRVAQLKIRPEREAQIRSEVKADFRQPVVITEFFHPRVEEVAALLPPRIGEFLLRSRHIRRWLEHLLGPRTLRTDTILAELILRLLASMRIVRRKTYGYAHEWIMIDRWYSAVLSAYSSETALAIAECGGMVKGYGATREKTINSLLTILKLIEASPSTSAQEIRSLRLAAMSSDDTLPFKEATDVSPV